MIVRVFAVQVIDKKCTAIALHISLVPSFNGICGSHCCYPYFLSGGIGGVITEIDLDLSIKLPEVPEEPIGIL